MQLKATPEPGTLARKRVHVAGLVQGVGFRPFVYRLAKSLHLTGWVRNTSQGVDIEAQGAPALLESFIQDLARQAPPLARVESVKVADIEPAGDAAFAILESKTSRGVEAVIPPDVGLCRDCAAEILDPRDRRYHYPFTNCTNCGPRFTIIRQVPYDRPRTTMSAFAMCAACEREYQDPADRRFHAEPTACPACGPKLWLEVGNSRVDNDVLETAGRLLREGRVVAVKGLGGFHLACDAKNDAAVQTLRQRKGRVAKPFAVMVRDLKEAERLCCLDAEARKLLLSPRNPVVLARKKPESGVSAKVAPGNNYLGLLLPYTPLHLLLFEHAPAALVMTSGNLSEEPLAFTNEEARTRLAGLADALLLHNRDIHVPCDDSVVRPTPGGMVIPLRRARGYVPQTVPLPLASPEILGVGAEQKNTFCLAWNHTALLSQHIGDLDTMEAFEFYRRAVNHFKDLARKDPQIIAHDLHPRYLSTRYALSQKEKRLIGVQHHHAHIAACLAENGRQEKCLGLALDGTGYGPDGSIWGGEILVADLAEFSRTGHLAQVRLPAGEGAVRQPAKMAVSYLHAAYGEAYEQVARDLGLEFSPLEWRVLGRQLATGLNAPLTSSAGRLFDAVAAALGICRERTYEGQPAVELEMAADPQESGFYQVPLRKDAEPFIVDTVSLFRQTVKDRLSGTDHAIVAARFHNSLVKGLAAACVAGRERTGLNLVALSGGVFQNALMAVSLKDRLEQAGFEVLAHRLVPPNDGGISLGQVAVAAAKINRKTEN
ncbi:MAG: carbamoyltransferase HypF [Deltaproteobacteria bacterium]|nr:carbamoyltransferase HypF [Deltaproteobacteria bacterium]